MPRAARTDDTCSGYSSALAAASSRCCRSRSFPRPPRALESGQSFTERRARHGDDREQGQGDVGSGGAKGVLKQIEKEGVDYLLFWFTDIEGHLKSFAITLDEVEGALDDGMGFDGSSVTGFNAIEESDMVAIPDPATFRLMPTRREARRRSAA